VTGVRAEVHPVAVATPVGLGRFGVKAGYDRFSPLQLGNAVHHSDRGVQYACGDYTAILRAHDIQASMSRVGNPYDNAKAESFMKTLKQEEVGCQRLS